MNLGLFWSTFGKLLTAFVISFQLQSCVDTRMIQLSMCSWHSSIISKLQLTSAKHWNWFDNNNNDTTTATTTTTTNTTNTTITTTTTTNNNNNNTKANPRKCHLYCLVLKLFKLYLLGKKKYSCFQKCEWREKSSPGRSQIYFS